MNPLPLVIYHHPCADGFTAAWVAVRALKKVEMYPANYGQPPPPAGYCEGREVYILDFSYPREVLERLERESMDLVVLDHHKTAALELEGLPYALFDMTRSGAMLAWDHFYPDRKDALALVKYVQDRDLWTKQLPHIEEISALIKSTDLTLKAWTELALHLDHNFDDAVTVGEGALRYRNALVKGAVEGADMGYFRHSSPLVPIACVSQEIRSDVGNALLLAHPEAPYSVTVRVTAEGYSYSLRSTDERADVGEICARMRNLGALNGGGHRNAAGFASRIPWHVYAAKGAR